MIAPTATVMGPRVRFEGVSLTLGGTRILDDITFTIAPGSLHALVGPNGGGKSSLVRALMGFVTHTGTIALDWPTHRVIGYVPQQVSIDATLPVTVEDFLAMWWCARPAFLGVGRRSRPALDAALARVGLAGKRRRLLGQLSGGEWRRLLLAQALAPGPALLVLDEPFTALDVAGTAWLRELLVELTRAGATVLLVDHDLAQVAQLANTVTALNRRVLFHGSPAELVARATVADPWPEMTAEVLR